jgi:hypothetical protein
MGALRCASEARVFRLAAARGIPSYITGPARITVFRLLQKTCCGTSNPRPHKTRELESTTWKRRTSGYSTASEMPDTTVTDGGEDDEGLLALDTIFTVSRHITVCLGITVVHCIV